MKGAPDHLIEILAPSIESNDKTLKRALYERTGVGELLDVDQPVTEKRVSVTYLSDVEVDLN